MKKIFTILLLTALISTNIQAQEKRFNWGGKVGFNVSSLTGKGVPDEFKGSYKGDLVIGAFAGYRVAKWVSFGAELLYSGQGTKYDGEEIYLDISYLSLPVMVNFHPVKGLAIKSGIQTNYSLGLRVRANRDAESSDHPLDDMKPLVYSVPIGISYTLKSGFVFDVRYTMDITSIDSEMDIFNSVISITLGLRL